MKKLLLFGSNSIHTYNYFNLIKDYFDDILLVSDKQEGICNSLPKKVLCYSFRVPFRINSLIRETGRIIDEYNPDIVHIQQIDTRAFTVIKALKKKSIFTVVTAWGSDVLLNPQKSFLLKKMVQYVLNNGDYFTSDSHFMADKMRSLSKKQLDITIANFGIDPVSTSVPKENIIYSNRFHHPLYRIDSIILAFNKFLSHNQDWKLIIAATGDQTSELKKMVSSLGLNKNILFTGWVDASQNTHFYSIAKCWISIPISDATSISLLEAMSFDCIPIVSSLPANKEWVTDKINGIVVNNIEDDFISKALEIDREKAITINRQLIEKNATKSVNKEKFISVYNKIFLNYKNFNNPNSKI